MDTIPLPVLAFASFFLQALEEVVPLMILEPRNVFYAILASVPKPDTGANTHGLEFEAPAKQRLKHRANSTENQLQSHLPPW